MITVRVHRIDADTKMKAAARITAYPKFEARPDYLRSGLQGASCQSRFPVKMAFV